MTKKSTKTVSLREVLDAIRKNGKQFGRGAFFYIRGDIGDDQYVYGYDDGAARKGYKQSKIVKACAIGQAALNLHVNPTDLQDALGSQLASSIISINDGGGSNSFDAVVDSFLRNHKNVDLEQQIIIRAQERRA